MSRIFELVFLLFYQLLYYNLSDLSKMSRMSNYNDYQKSCMTPIHYVPPLSRVSMDKASHGRNQQHRLNMTTNVNYKAFMYQSPDSSRETGRSRFVSQSLNCKSPLHLLPIGKYLDDYTHYTNLNNIKAGVRKDNINRVPSYKSPKSLKTKM